MIEAGGDALREAIQRVFSAAPFVARLGVELQGLGAGWCETALAVQPWQLQQNAVVHAGVIATLADHTAGAAAHTLLPPGQHVLTAEFKINLLRPASGPRLTCRAQVLKPGRRLIVVEAEVRDERNGRQELIAKLNATMAVVEGAG